MQQRNIARHRAAVQREARCGRAALVAAAIGRSAHPCQSILFADSIRLGETVAAASSISWRAALPPFSQFRQLRQRVGTDALSRQVRDEESVLDQRCAPVDDGTVRDLECAGEVNGCKRRNLLLQQVVKELQCREIVADLMFGLQVMASGGLNRRTCLLFRKLVSFDLVRGIRTSLLRAFAQSAGKRNRDTDFAKPLFRPLNGKKPRSMPFVYKTFIMVGMIAFFVTARFTILHYFSLRGQGFSMDGEQIPVDFRRRMRSEACGGGDTGLPSDTKTHQAHPKGTRT